MAFKPVKQDRIAVAIVNQLKAAIFSGRFKPGERMPTERELTEQFQVSRVVVREAIRELEIKGFVKILQGPSGGAYVTDLSFDQLNNAFLDLFHSNKLSVAELIQTRILVECEIARLAAAQAQPESAAPCRTRSMPRGPADCRIPASSPTRLMVHHLLAEMSGNRVLQAIASSLFRLTGEVILEVKPVEEVIHRQEEHAEIVRAVLARDPNAAAAAMQRHLESMGKLVKLEGIYRRKMGRTA